MNNCLAIRGMLHFFALAHLVRQLVAVAGLSHRRGADASPDSQVTDRRAICIGSPGFTPNASWKASWLRRHPSRAADRVRACRPVRCAPVPGCRPAIAPLLNRRRLIADTRPRRSNVGVSGCRPSAASSSRWLRFRRNRPSSSFPSRRRPTPTPISHEASRSPIDVYGRLAYNYCA